MIKKLIIVFILFNIVACNTVPDIPAISVKETRVNIDAEHLTPCEPLIKLSPELSELETTIQNFELFAKCKKKQDNSIILLKKFSNYKEPAQ